MIDQLRKIFPPWPLLITIIGILITVFGIYCGWCLFPSMIHKKVEENVIITRDSEQLKRFVKLPQPLLFKVYIFNVTNPQSIQRGGIPIVEEIGPYIYKQFCSRRITHFSQDGSKITFVQDQLYTFDKEASAPLSDADNLVVLNMHMNAFLQVFEREVTDILQGFANRINYRLNQTPGVRLLKHLMDRIRGKRKNFLEWTHAIINYAINTTKSILDINENDPSLAVLLMHLNANIKDIFNNPDSMFIKTTVKDYLFEGVRFCNNTYGLAKTICNQIKESGLKTLREMPDGSLSFAFFHHKNGTGEEVFEVHTGKNDAMRLLEIQKVDDSQNLQIWLNNSETNESSICNEINGTDASMFPPFRQKGEHLYIYSPDICRSVQLIYQYDIVYKGIDGYRYSIGENFINDIGPEYNNNCFCIDKLTNVIKRKNGCLYSGALDLSNCLGAPVILTLPHMLGASNEYTKTIKGLRPDAHKHRMFVDIQPMTGLPLQGGKKVQFNMFLKSINRIKITENLRTVLMPALWIDEGIELNDEMVHSIKVRLIHNIKILHIIQWIIACSGLTITLISFMYFICKQSKSFSRKISQ